MYHKPSPKRIAIWNADIQGDGNIVTITITMVDVNDGILIVTNRRVFISRLHTLESFKLHFEELPSAKILTKYRRQTI